MNSSKVNVEEIKQALAAATPGPWVNDCNNATIWNRRGITVIRYGLYEEDANLELIANAPTYLAKLLEERAVMVEALKDIEHDSELGSFIESLARIALQKVGELP